MHKCIDLWNEPLIKLKSKTRTFFFLSFFAIQNTIVLKSCDKWSFETLHSQYHFLKDLSKVLVKKLLFFETLCREKYFERKTRMIWTTLRNQFSRLYCLLFQIWCQIALLEDFNARWDLRHSRRHLHCSEIQNYIQKNISWNWKDHHPKAHLTPIF